MGWRRESNVASFRVLGWDMEIFGSRIPVAEQPAWRHFDVEKRLLSLGGQRLRDVVMRFRAAGMKTEPAFATALGLAGNPYDALLSLQMLGDDQLRSIIDDLSFGSL